MFKRYGDINEKPLRESSPIGPTLPRFTTYSPPAQEMIEEECTATPLEEPETTLGENISVKGQLKFDSILRVDGSFEGELISEGKLIVGPKGFVKAEINLREAYISGKVEGNITVSERLVLRGHAEVMGDITAQSLSVDEGVSIEGVVTVKPSNII